MNSSQILELLSEKHSKDIYVEECKNGSTYFQHHRRIDAWVMKKSWSNPAYIGYEIKVSKSDFNRDAKYIDYLTMCNELYFVCPWKMIEVSEIPLEIGLIYVTKNEKSLLTRKKAVYRKIDDPINTLKYVLMIRSKIVNENYYFDKSEYWKNWYKNKSDEIDIGHLIGKRIRKVVNDKIIERDNIINRVRSENLELISILKNTQHIIDKLESMGITIKDLKSNTGWGARNIDYKIDKLTEKVPEELIRSIKSLNDITTNLLSEYGSMGHFVKG